MEQNTLLRVLLICVLLAVCALTVVSNQVARNAQESWENRMETSVASSQGPRNAPAPNWVDKLLQKLGVPNRITAASSAYKPEAKLGLASDLLAKTAPIGPTLPQVSDAELQLRVNIAKRLGTDLANAIRQESKAAIAKSDEQVAEDKRRTVADYVSRGDSEAEAQAKVYSGGAGLGVEVRERHRDVRTSVLSSYRSRIAELMDFISTEIPGKPGPSQDRFSYLKYLCTVAPPVEGMESCEDELGALKLP